jgi:type II secretory pathway pseudopilin PulG
MRQRFKTSSPARGRGVTLIEALAGLVILGTLLVSITIARGRFIRQRALAEQKIAAAAAVDRLVSKWMAGNAAAIPASSQGSLDGLPNYFWRTHIIPDRAASDVGASIVRMEVIGNQNSPPIISLDLLRHNDRRTGSSGGAP